MEITEHMDMWDGYIVDVEALHNSIMYTVYSIESINPCSSESYMYCSCCQSCLWGLI